MEFYDTEDFVQLIQRRQTEMEEYKKIHGEDEKYQEQLAALYDAPDAYVRCRASDTTGERCVEIALVCILDGLGWHFQKPDWLCPKCYAKRNPL